MGKVIRLPVDLERRVAAAPLVPNYAAACDALSECVRVDEAAVICNKSEALIIYARQSRDETLLHLAQRLKLRALGRVGELLSEIAGKPERKSAAKSAGLTAIDAQRAQTIAKCPRQIRDPLIERRIPPTVYEIQRSTPGYSPRTWTQKPDDLSPFQSWFRGLAEFDPFLAELTPSVLAGMSYEDCVRALVNVSDAQKAINEAQERLDEYERLLTHFRDGGQLRRIVAASGAKTNE